MNVAYPESIDPQHRLLLEKATCLLDATMRTTSTGEPAINTTSGGVPTIGTAPIDIEAQWTVRRDDGGLMYVLTLSHSADPSLRVSEEFYPSDLQDLASPALLPFRMAHLWGDLLEKYSHKQFAHLIKHLEAAGHH